MQYELEISLELPPKRVVELFDSVENLKQWQEGLQSFTHKNGSAAKEGAQSDIVFEMEKRRIEMAESIKRNLAKTFSATYEAAGIWFFFNTCCFQKIIL